MEQEDMPCWVESFAEFCACFDDLFARSKSREQARKYVHGLLTPLEGCVAKKSEGKCWKREILLSCSA